MTGRRWPKVERHRGGGWGGLLHGEKTASGRRDRDGRIRRRRLRCVQRPPQRRNHRGRRRRVLSCPTAWEWEQRFNQPPANLSPEPLYAAFLRTGTGLGTEAGFMNSGSGWDGGWGGVSRYAGGERARDEKKREKCNLVAGQTGIDVKMRVGHTCK